MEEFNEKPPKIEIMGKIIKFKFSHIPSLKILHKQALEEYTPNYIEFLNQIYLIYTIDTLNEVEPLLVKHKQIHF